LGYSTKPPQLGHTTDQYDYKSGAWHWPSDGRTENLCLTSATHLCGYDDV